MPYPRDTKEILATAIPILVGTVIFAALGSFAYLALEGLVGKMWTVVWHNFQFPTALIILVGFGIFWKLKYPTEFTWSELGIYAAVLPLVAFPFAAIFFYFATDLNDTEIWNGRATIITYEEKWTEEVTYTEEECSGSGKDEICTTVVKTRHDYHPPRWYLTTNNGEHIHVSSKQYKAGAERLGNETFKRLFRANQVSIGDGNMYYSEWRGETSRMIPTAVEHAFVNYLRASKSITKISGTADAYKELLLPYPRVREGPYGRVEIDRVLLSGLKISDQWDKEVSAKLSQELAVLGSEKQVNVIVYVVNADPGFFYALKEHWVDGKKNDIIVVVGSGDGNSIDWVQVQAWTKVELFKIELADSLRALKTFNGKAEKFVETIVAQVVKDPEKGGFQRMPMKELEYLLVEIKLPWWASIMVIVLNIVLVAPIIFFLLFNNLRSRRA